MTRNPVEVRGTCRIVVTNNIRNTDNNTGKLQALPILRDKQENIESIGQICEKAIGAHIYKQF